LRTEKTRGKVTPPIEDFGANVQLSLEKRFLFVEVPKTGSMSIAHLLAPYVLPRHRTTFRRFTSNLPFREPADHLYLRQHDPAYWAQIKLGARLFSELYKFGFVRHPLDRLVSAYEFLKQYEITHPQSLKIHSFSEYIKYRRRSYKINGRDQAYFLTGRREKLLVDKVYRFENINADVHEIVARLGVEGELSHKHKTKRRDYREYYADVDRQNVYDIVARDANVFGYDFDL
jgi:hypothetical protein